MNVEKVIERLKQHFGVKTDTELASALGLAQTSISAWKRRGSVPLQKIITKSTDIDITWLVNGVSAGPVAGEKVLERIKVAEPDIGYLSHAVGGDERLTEIQESIAAGRKPFIGDLTDHEHTLRELVGRPGSLLSGNVTGDSMQEAGIKPGDVVIVNIDIMPVHNDIVVANYNNELLVKRFCIIGDEPVLMSANLSYIPIKVNSHDTVVVIGVVESIIRPFQSYNKTSNGKVRS